MKLDDNMSKCGKAVFRQENLVASRILICFKIRFFNRILIRFFQEKLLNNPLANRSRIPFYKANDSIQLQEFMENFDQSKFQSEKHLRESESSVLTPVHLPIKSSESSRQSSSKLVNSQIFDLYCIIIEWALSCGRTMKKCDNKIKGRKIKKNGDLPIKSEWSKWSDYSD